MTYTTAKAAVFVIAAGLTATGLADPIKDRIDQARAAYLEDTKKAHNALLAALQNKEDAAQKAGDLAQLKRVRTDQTGFLEESRLPTSVSTTEYTESMTKARIRLEAALSQGLKDYTKAGRVAEAEAIEAEIRDLKQTKGVPAASSKATKSEESVDRRQLWVEPHGYFIHGLGKDWFQKWDDGNKPPNLFKEIQRTKEYIELRHYHMPVYFRLYAAKNTVKDELKGQTEFVLGGEGKWLPPPK